MKNHFHSLTIFALIGIINACSYLPDPDLLDFPGVRIVDHRDYIELVPESQTISPLSIMFWPGGLVDPHAYRGSLGQLAARGYRIIIAKVAANLAVFSADKGWELTQKINGRWVAAGHSLGGAMASWSVHDHPDDFAGLILMAAYPTEDKSLAGWDGGVLSLSAQYDGLTTPSDIADSVPLLPQDTVFYEIPGGNHAGFGAYGEQDGDGKATLTAQQQHIIMADQMETFLQNLEANL